MPFSFVRFFPFCFFSFLFAYTASPRLSHTAALCGAVDVPDGGRHLHARATPRAGGLAFFFAFSLALLVYLFRFGAGEDAGLFLALAGGGGGIAAAGMLDDATRLGVGKKLWLSFLASLLAVAAGCRIPALPIALSVLLSLFLLLSLVNAQNFIDGMDALSGGSAVLSVGLLALDAWILGEGGVFLAASLLFFAVLGFLPHNLPPARLFMGDTGSLFLGYAIGVLILFLWQAGGGAELLLFAAVPLSDLIFVVLRRLLAGVSPFSADRRHLHHALYAAGGNALTVPLIFYGGTALCGILGLLLTLF